MPNYLIFLFAFISCSGALALEQEPLEKLSQDPHWLKLLHYSNPYFGNRISDIDEGQFFLAKDGNKNPHAELLETIKNLQSSKESYCRYPARRNWLESKGFTFSTHQCEEYSAWTRDHSVKSLSMIFATGFLGNPASFFGHPLLKFNFKDEKSPLDMLDTAINYGAFTPPDVDPASYAINGMFGGYKAGFTSADFFYHANNYSELELRDMWEYELELSPKEVELIVGHLWELKEAKLNYYFFSDNCAYRMSELLELGSGKKFIGKTPFAIPSTLFHQIHDYELYSNLKLLKSRQSRMSDKVESLSDRERTQLEKIVRNSAHLKSDEFQNASDQMRSKVLDAAIDYYSFLISKDTSQSDLKEKRKILLRERVSLPPESVNWNDSKPRPPHEAQKPILTQLGLVQSEKFGKVGTLRMRPVYYDFISPDAGRPSYSSLGVMDFELNLSDDRLWLKNLNLISIETLNISRTGLEGDGGMAWRVKAGADQVTLACNTCTVPRVEVGAGKAFEFSKKFAFYGMIDPRLQTHLGDYGFFSLTPSFGTLITLSEKFRVHASAGKRYQIDVGHRPENIFNVEGRFGNSREWDLRMTFQQHVDRRYGLSMSLYW